MVHRTSKQLVFIYLLNEKYLIIIFFYNKQNENN